MPVYDRDGQDKVPRLPRLGIIRLGHKEERKRQGTDRTITVPRAADHFVLTDAPQVSEIFGETPTVPEPVILPGEDEEM